ncbi:DUF536 domain-containing protein [Lactococcus garvieae]|uniref:DUF536 domain-containing protein n=1 Tax=Lactococcus garvieae TaxID=1363 RepID=A0AA46YTC1_9LACT|nr:DUF536 domain-containing protein [Lactococcus garvieae]UYT10346.1 DUF536 domain-containing protein [Lactococcus garvieae]UYT12383.1 DUF536 domain-containing protein [Lactococcus garvieae]
MTIREFATEFSIEIKQVQNKVAYIRRKNKKFGTLDTKGVRVFDDAEIKHLKEVLNVAEKPTELSTEFSREIGFLKTQLDVKDEQILKLQQALDQQQQLTLMAQKSQEDLRLELAEEKKKTWWQKLRGK